MKNANTQKVLGLLIGELKLPITKASVIAELEKCPNSSSLLAASNCLDGWNVPNAAYNATTDNFIY